MTKKKRELQFWKWNEHNRKAGIDMKKLRKWIEDWLDGKQIRGMGNISLATIWELVDICNGIARKEKPSFINGTVKEILDKCGIETVVEGIGWRVV